MKRPTNEITLAEAARFLCTTEFLARKFLAAAGIEPVASRKHGRGSLVQYQRQVVYASFDAFVAWERAFRESLKNERLKNLKEARLKIREAAIERRIEARLSNGAPRKPSAVEKLRDIIAALEQRIERLESRTTYPHPDRFHSFKSSAPAVEASAHG